MDANFEFFEKFIVKQIVSTVDYNPEKDEYEINRIHISDDIIRTIEKEGARYGLEKNQIGQIITQVSGNVKTIPSSKLIRGTVEVGKLAPGQHLCVHLMHPDKGAKYVEMLILNVYKFYVLSTDVAGLMYGDILHALDNNWSNSYFIDFIVSRKGARIPNDTTILRLGKVESIELFHPSVVHEILDSKLDFTYESFKKKDKPVANKTKASDKSTPKLRKLVKASEKSFTKASKAPKVPKEPSPATSSSPTKPLKKTNKVVAEETKTVIDVPKIKDYYFWIPNRFSPILFIWEEGDVQEYNAPFIITDSEKSSVGLLRINKNFTFSKVEHANSFMDLLQMCCDVNNVFLGVDNLIGIKKIKDGKVKRVKSELGVKEWTLVEKPLIEYVYG